ncbi:MAG: ATP-dependent zinc metalloprotease FtsH [Bacteroidaceae bacterium]|nr:ATP-dependent zinc metalloprotease FtsH [Bacteroidaceae bacterium]
MHSSFRFQTSTERKETLLYITALEIRRKQPNNNNNRKQPFNLVWIYPVLFGGIVIAWLMGGSSPLSKKVSYSEFKQYVEKGYAEKIVSFDNNKVEMTVFPDSIASIFGETMAEQASKSNQPVIFTSEAASRDTFDEFISEQQEKGHFAGELIYQKSDRFFSNFLWNIVPFLLIIGFYILIIRRMGGGSGGGGGGGVFSVGKSKAQLFEKDKADRITFKDVAGQAEAKQEVEEIVEFLKNPGKYTELGGKIPKGALLVGPPGTGKTLLAKAVAGEANVPFFSLSGSDFVEMFVGVGASRVRDLFRQAKEKAPCIIFIDEIDAVGRARGKNPAMGGNDERESTLNQLLTEMDGFGTNSGVIILAATNRVDILDKALLRAGRFDRQIHVDLPDLNERKEVFGVHLRPLKLHPNVDVDLLARQTPGFSGADIANVCNEAALIAARHGKNAVDKDDFLAAVDRIIGGLEKKTKVLTQEEKHTIALHEAGHATLSWFLQWADPLIKVTIVPRGNALGAAWYLPEERQINTREQMLDEMCALLGGRAAEELFTGHISTGAMNDLERVTKQAYGMIAYAGMSDNLPNICYYNNEEYSFSKPYSERTAEQIDKEAMAMIAEQYERAKRLLQEHREGHAQLAQLLMEREVIFAEDAERIFGKRPWASRSEEILDENPSDNAEEEAKPAFTPLKKGDNVTLTPPPSFDADRLTLTDPLTPSSDMEKESGEMKKEAGEIPSRKNQEKKEKNPADTSEDDAQDDDDNKSDGPKDQQTTLDFF